MAYSFDRLLASGELDTVGVARFLCGIGVDAVELMERYLPEGSDDALRDDLARVGSTIAAYDLACDFVTDDAAARRAEAERVRGSLERAARLGARQVLIVPGRLKP